MPEHLNPTTHRDPSPTEHYPRIKIGDVGFIRNGQFHLLFSAGSPQTPGEGVPITFEPLIVGDPVLDQPRRPDCLRTSTVQQLGAGLDATGGTTT